MPTENSEAVALVQHGWSEEGDDGRGPATSGREVEVWEWADARRWAELELGRHEGRSRWELAVVGPKGEGEQADEEKRDGKRKRFGKRKKANLNSNKKKNALA